MKTTINLNEYISKYGDISFDLSVFLVNNNWFGIKPIVKNSCVYIDKSDFEIIKNKIDMFCNNNKKSIYEKSKLLLNQMNKSIPSTKKLLCDYCKEKNYKSDVIYVLSDFLLCNLPGELKTSDDREIQDLMDAACLELTKKYGDILCNFLLWCMKHSLVNYRNIYKFNKTYTNNNYAYDEEEYLHIMYRLFNEEHIKINNMYEKAANSKDYIDTWLFMSLSFVSVIRSADNIRMPHPKLTLPPETILEQVKNGTFSESDAKATLYSIIYSLAYNPRRPNKTKKYDNIANIKFYISESLETHMGILFAVAESHFIISKCKGNLIRRITKYERIKRYMGDDIGDLFLFSDFKPIAANKSFMQSMMINSDDILGNDSNNTNGYLIASLARSHKGSFSNFSKTTLTYLKDAKANGLTSEFVAKELFERGPLSFVVSKLLSTITYGEYDQLSFTDQTKIIKCVGLSPNEIENIVGITQKLISNANDIVKELYKENVDIKKVLHKLATKNVSSKDNTCLCLMHAIGKTCPFANITTCINCNYEVGTKYTMIILVAEYKRLLQNFKNSNEINEKNKYKSIAVDIILPRIEEMLICMKNTYGEESIVALEKMLEEI